MRRLMLVVMATVLVGALAGLALSARATADESGRTAAATPFTVDDAVLSWGLNDESNNRAFAPGTFNFLSAGTVPDPGRGGQNIVAPGVWRGTSTTAWRARAGDVTLQKPRPDGSFTTATFAGLSTAVDGSPLTSTNGPFSGHRILLSGGSGTVDPAAGTARLQWTGSFSVVYYSGFTFFTVSDPVLVVADGVARLRATLAGFAADRDDPSRWSPVPPKQVVLADLPGGLVLPAEGGFTAQPAYLGVRYDAPPANGADQVRQGASWGAFPTSFLTYMNRVGSAAFWYSSGGSADAFKVPKPLTISYDAGAPVEPPVTETPLPSTTPEPTTTVNPPPPPTTPPPAPSPTPPSPVVTQPPGPSLPTQPPPAGPPPPADAVAAVPVAVVSPPTVYALSSETTTPGPDSDPLLPPWRWWVGSALLLGAAALTLLSTRAKGTP